MDPSDILLALLTAAVAASWGQTQWRLARVEREIAEVKVQLADKPDRVDLTPLIDVKIQLADKPDRADLTPLVEELRKKPDRDELTALRTEFTALRADLTQIALAVGASHPHASEG